MTNPHGKKSNSRRWMLGGPQGQTTGFRERRELILLASIDRACDAFMRKRGLVTLTVWSKTEVQES